MAGIISARGNEDTPSPFNERMKYVQIYIHTYLTKYYLYLFFGYEPGSVCLCFTDCNFIS